MFDRRIGFLWNDERGLVDAYRASTTSWSEPREEDLDEVRDPGEVKSRMKGDIASPEGLREALQTVHRDLERIEAYHCRVRNQPGGRWEWTDQILPRIQPDMERISLLLDRWERESERDAKERVREILVDALRPLYEGLDSYNRALDGKYSQVEIEMAQKGESAAPDELTDDFQELKARREAFLALLMDAELRVIFHYIGFHEGKKLPDRKKGGNPWSWWTSRYLETEYGLVEEYTWGYQFTRRGDLVNKVLWNLEDKPLLEMLGEGTMSTAEAALQLLPYHVRADRWSAWEDA